MLKFEFYILALVLFFIFGYGISVSGQQTQTLIIITPGASEPGANSPFFPTSISLPVGSTVNWTNKDHLTHTVTSFTNSFDSGLLSPDQSYTETFYRPGYYNYYCSIHPYMNGEINIG